MLRRLTPASFIRRRVAASSSAAAFSSRGSSTASWPQDAYVNRHVGPTDSQSAVILRELGCADESQFLSKVIPSAIRRPNFDSFEPLSESDALKHLRTLMSKNRTNYKSLIGQGYYEAVTPAAIVRNVLESPGWYTPYTPYQAEISQGRLESLLNYQTMIMDLVKNEYSNASLLDQATSASEAMYLCHGFHKRAKRDRFFVASSCFTSVIEMIRTRAEPIGVEVVVGDPKTWNLADPKLCGILVQTPDATGALHDFSELFAAAKAQKVVTCCGTDLLACAITKPAGEMGADVVFGSAQRFGIPLGFGGPHAAFFTVRDQFKRLMPGRLIGVSKDRQGQRALRMALQTREQHIKRENATSNICTAQALLSNMSAFYGIYHGPEGIKQIATGIHERAKILAKGLEFAGHQIVNNGNFFDTITVMLGNGMTAKDFNKNCVQRKINPCVVNERTVSISIDEATHDEHIAAVLEAGGIAKPDLSTLRGTVAQTPAIPANLLRTSAFMTAPVFNQHRSESSLMRYIYGLQRKDFGLNIGMIPLGSCTMKLNAAATMIPMSWSEVGNLHPLVPEDQAEGYRLMAHALEEKLKSVTGFAAVSLQPNSGAQGEYAGLRVIRAYHQANGQGHRNVLLIPVNAHGTNPATSTLCGYNIAPVACEPNGKIDLKSLAEQLQKHGNNVAGAMVTYPSTYGIYDAGISTVTRLVHEAGGQMYIDGANFNAMVGFTGPEFFDGDVCHINMHKTFAIPHGGGGPGMGPICCRAHLAPFLPNSTGGVRVGGSKAFGQVSQSGYGSASILNISYMEMIMLGSEGLKKSTYMAMLNANYLRHKLKDDFPALYLGDDGFVAHEFIMDLRMFKQHGIEAEDVAKRLMDYGFHAPTLSFPVVGTLMVEPTESEPLEELDRFVRAMKSIRREIQDIIDGKQPRENNVLKNAPHTSDVVTADKWDRPYSRELAAFPDPCLRAGAKYWPTVSRIDNEYGDLNLMCSCAPMPQA